MISICIHVFFLIDNGTVNQAKWNEIQMNDRLPWIFEATGQNENPR